MRGTQIQKSESEKPIRNDQITPLKLYFTIVWGDKLSPMRYVR